MSEVAVSPSAAALRSLVGLPRAASGVRRSLFGPLDHGELRRELQSRLQGMAEEARERWGFDFQAGRPVPGAGLRWEPVCGSVVPAFYREKSQGACRPGQGAEVPAEGTPVSAAGPDTAEPASACALDTDCAGEESNQENRGLVLRARGVVRRPAESTGRITDFFPKRKRSVDTKAPCELLSSGLSIPVEQTPRKRLR